MAEYYLYIPTAAFAVNGPLYGENEKTARILIPLRTKDSNGFMVGSENTTTKVALNDFDLQPFSTMDYATILNMITKGILEIAEVGGAVIDENDFVTLYRTMFQQL
jgi:hypothetical protein